MLSWLVSGIGRTILFLRPCRSSSSFEDCEPDPAPDADRLRDDAPEWDIVEELLSATPLSFADVVVSRLSSLRPEFKVSPSLLKISSNSSFLLVFFISLRPLHEEDSSVLDDSQPDEYSDSLSYSDSFSYSGSISCAVSLSYGKSAIKGRPVSSGKIGRDLERRGESISLDEPSCSVCSLLIEILFGFRCGATGSWPEELGTGIFLDRLNTSESPARVLRSGEANDGDAFKSC